MRQTNKSLGAYQARAGQIGTDVMWIAAWKMGVLEWAWMMIAATCATLLRT